MAVTKRCAVSIDLDGLFCYYRIHGLGPGPESGSKNVMPVGTRTTGLRSSSGRQGFSAASR